MTQVLHAGPVPGALPDKSELREQLYREGAGGRGFVPKSPPSSLDVCSFPDLPCLEPQVIREPRGWSRSRKGPSQAQSRKDGKEGRTARDSGGAGAVSEWGVSESDWNYRMCVPGFRKAVLFFPPEKWKNKKKKERESCSVMSNSLWPHGLYSHRILQARILEWVAIFSSRGSSDPGMEPTSLVSPAVVGRFFTTESPGKPTERRDAAVIKGSQWILKAQEKNQRSMCGQRLCNYHSGKGVLLSVHNLVLGGIYINKTKQLKTNSREGLS